MNIEKILSENLINKTELARRIWPDVSQPAVKLANKLGRKQYQRLTDEDKKAIEDYLKKYFK